MRMRVLHPDTRLVAKGEDAFGVVATRLIPRGTITWTRDPLDQALPAAKLSALPGVLRDPARKAGFLDRDGALVVPWDGARHVAHSCAPATLPTGYGFQVALRDIRADSELTVDYAARNLERTFTCSCGAEACRGEVRPDDVYDWAERWDEQLARALPALRQVVQPLWDLVPASERAALEKAFEKKAFASIGEHLVRLRARV